MCLSLTTTFRFFFLFSLLIYIIFVYKSDQTSPLLSFFFLRKTFADVSLFDSLLLCYSSILRMMNSCALQEKNALAVACEEMGRDCLVRPKPRRVGSFHNSPINSPSRPLRWHLSHQAEICDSDTGSDLLDFILSKGGGRGVKQSCTQLASSPPYFSGSPPSRVANPIVQDARFQDEKLAQLHLYQQQPFPAQNFGMSSPSSSSRKSGGGGGGCIRKNFGNNPAVRVEGFDCLDRDSRNCSIPALA